MRIRVLMGLLLFSLGVAACAPAGEQPAFNWKAIPEATSIPMRPQPRVVATLAQRIDSFDVDPDATVIALATSSGVRLYDLATFKYLRSLNDGELVGSVAWSPDGSRLAVGSTKDYGTPFFQGGDSTNSDKAHLTVWDTSTWKSVFEPAFGNEMVNQMFRDLAWSPDGRLLAFSTDLGGVRVLDLKSGQTISQQGGFSSTVLDITWSPDGARLAATGDMAYGIRRWKVIDDEAVRLFDPRASSSMAIAWSPDGKRIASGHYLGGVCLWTVVTNRCDGFIEAHRTATFSLAWSPDGNELATGGGVIRIWDTRTGKLMRAFGEDAAYEYSRLEWPLQPGPIVSLETSFEDPHNTLLRLWDPSSGAILAEFRAKQPAE